MVEDATKKLQMRFPTIPVKASPKMYFKKYVGKVSMGCFNKVSLFDLGMWAGRNYPKGTKPDYRLRRDDWYNETITQIYFTSSEDIVSFTDEQYENITEITVPINQKQIDVTTNDDKIRIKKKLFYGEYRFRVTFKHLSSKKHADLDSWCEEVLHTDRVHFNEFNWYPTLFLTDEDDLVITKLAHHEDITLVERAVLESEVKRL